MESNAESSNAADLRENHRIRERMRRESMTPEDRERSLARRRYNYHQRRASTITLNGNPTSENSHAVPMNVAAGSSITTRVTEHTSNPRRSSTILRFQHTIPDNTTEFCSVPPSNNDDSLPQTTPTIRARRGRRGFHNIARDFHESYGCTKFQLPEPKTCPYCQAKLFHRETSNMCCANGKIVLPTIPAPAELQDLFCDQTAEGRHFRQHIRSYNHVFAFTSMGVHVDPRYATGRQGVYTFRAQGAIYHQIGGLLPNVDCRPRYLQLYVYDTDHEIDNRMSESDALNRDLIEKLKRILDNNNPFVNVFRQLGQRKDVSHCRLVIKEQPSNRNQYHLPTASQVAAVIVGGEELANLNGRDIIVETISGHLRNIQDIVGYYDPLQYPLLLPYGTYGWDVNTRTNNRANVSCRDFYAYILQIRPNNPSLLLRGGRLLQQYVVDNWVKIETHKLRWIRSHQDVIRAELYQGLHDSLHAGENDAGNVGRRTILPSSFYGSPRDMYQRYQDAMALVQRFGSPDLFLTMTCNPNWDDIRNELLPGQLPQDRPDLLSRIFRARFEEFKVDVIQKGVFGKVIAHAYVIEYQKRGLPHSHMILILDEADKLRTPDDYDRIVRAEIPAQQEEPALYEGVLKHMIHGPCGVTNPLCPCMKDGQCKRSYPKPFSAYTKQGSASYPTYRRRDTGISVPVNSSGTVFVDNGWVVPYNPWVLLKYDCHINVEICASVKCIKYLYKYVYKGPDRVALEVRPGPNYDEVQSFIDARWVSAPEALWRMFMFQMNHLYPSVVRLQIHLPNRQQIRFYEDETISNVLSNDQRSKTMLTEFFTLNRLNSNARQFLYRDIPEHFRWVDSQKIWVERTGHNKVIGRIYTVSPSEGERFYLRILLNHVKGPRSFTDMATVNGVVYSTFRKAAEELGLLHEDGYLRHCLQEAAAVRMPSVLRRLFVSILVFCEPNGVRQLWDEFHTHMLEDYASSSTPSNMVFINKLLLELKNQLHQHNKDICDFDLPSVTEEFNDNVGLPTLISDELAVAIPHDDLTSIAKLNCDQSLAFDAIIGAVERRQNYVFFVDGPGGTGKTYLYRAILANLRKNGHIAIATATSGIAATLLPGGRTAHSRFKIPLNPDASSVCSISRQSDLAELIKRATLIMWDEATMTHRYAFEALDRTLQDIMHTDLPFGGKVIVLGGDFRQVLPVVPKGTKMQQIHASVVKSMIWNNVKVLRLGLNMRALDDRRFSDFLLRVGNGDEPTVRADLIKLPSSMVIPWEGSNSINHLINFVFPNIIDHSRDPTYMVGRALITPKNEDVDKLNDAIISMFPGNDMVYKSWDSVEDDINHLYQEEFLNSVCPSGLAPHKLTLREGCPVMLLRNIDPKRGLCNGTRLFCRKLYRNFIDAEILTGQFVGIRVFLHRIPMKSAENSSLPFELTRRQFPIKLSFALTINKAQGQTIPRVGIFLPDHVFSHGQLYVALSRGISESTTRVLVKRAEPGQHDNVVTRNVVYREVLLAASNI